VGGILKSLPEDSRFAFKEKIQNLLSEFLTRKDVFDKRLLYFLLRSKFLKTKCHDKLVTSSKTENENQILDPLKIYEEVENPFYQPKILHEKFIPELGKTLRIRELDLALENLMPNLDRRHFINWQKEDYVQHFWELGFNDDELNCYLTKKGKTFDHELLMIELDEERVGYFEVYWVIQDRLVPYLTKLGHHYDEFDRGIHLLIGNKNYLKTPLAYWAIHEVSDYLFSSQPKTKRIWGEPRSDNLKIKVLAEKLPGWKVLEEFDFPHKRSLLLRCDRGEFYKCK
jgi:RimJ/RimL family protein N-acetyltransferase